jgi:hypothetical protein
VKPTSTLDFKSEETCSAVLDSSSLKQIWCHFSAQVFDESRNNTMRMQDRMKNITNYLVPNATLVVDRI